jgi:CBS domain containing-hemolysin-like protein
LAGLVLDELGRRPDPGDAVAVGDVTIRVEAVDGLRITRLLVTLPDSWCATARFRTALQTDS